MTDDTSDIPPVRRTVTGHDAGKVAKAMIEAPATNRKFPRPGAVSALIWASVVTMSRTKVD